ncbi:unnamed protein product [Hermetia illucens]|uniref:Uncharacterized protein n=1 Tax=Hermetia illucens TaxID=343691 RepID=A0A7R8V6B4_HERIL|nr:uncharacterized protein LOC119659649 [Hermetia illucens]CAD7093508.1 unnamed protein product [Hermetia illucens]
MGAKYEDAKYEDSKFKESADDDFNSESVEVLRERLNTMKRLMAERTNSNNAEDWSRPHHTTTGIIDGNFLSVAFAGALLVIVTVSVYAFYNLYTAVLRRFPSHHTEL